MTDRLTNKPLVIFEGHRRTAGRAECDQRSERATLPRMPRRAFKSIVGAWAEPDSNLLYEQIAMIPRWSNSEVLNSEAIPGKIWIVRALLGA